MFSNIAKCPLGNKSPAIESHDVNKPTVPYLGELNGPVLSKVAGGLDENTNK